LPYWVSYKKFNSFFHIFQEALTRVCDLQYTLFANASTFGTPPVRALFFEFPDEPELFGVDEQFLVGGDILVTPVLAPNVSQVTGLYLFILVTLF
jgi:alpha-glucosidase (family GH31 glycosyl hydrolase)